MSLDVLGLACGGETGIRTLDTLRYTRFPSVRLQPLGHLSACIAGLFESNTIEGVIWHPPTLITVPGLGCSASHSRMRQDPSAPHASDIDAA
jgi:hypothetical protein